MKKFLIILGIIVAIAIAGVIAGSVYVNSVIQGEQGTGESKEFIIQPGESSSEIAVRLENDGLVKNAEIFQYYLWKESLTSKIQTGSFLLDPKGSMEDVASLITGVGKNPDEVTVTIVEGQRRDEIAEILEEKDLAITEEFMDLTKSTAPYLADFEFLSAAPEGATLEGFLFPDTYIFSKESATEDIVRKMLENFEKRTEGKRISADGRTFYENLVLASIVQDEVSDRTDKGLVAGIFDNRLEIGMKLQSDATLNFILKNNNIRPSIADTQIDDSYNTYFYEGLPPGPINNPGLLALEAVENPTESDYFFFLTKPSGEPVYSRNAAEHNAAKAEFLD